MSFRSLSLEIISCEKCPRLVAFREKISRERRKQFADFDYWGKPVPGYGDPAAELVVVGLAPAAHGGNRTGRIFTGDSSARFLVRHLFEAGFANQPTSETKDDGLVYQNCYLIAVARCVPPGDKPTRQEIENCSSYFERELTLLKNKKAILALGKVAFEGIVRFYKKYYGVQEKLTFRHGEKYVLQGDFPVLFASYHTSPRNTNTGKLTSEMFRSVLTEINTFLARS
ncbi:MAG: uracil-DNA glycosylase [Thaumarchaeota archaeon]|nr:uracil-DNA glycosylase [Nitrososphaerota archaeon]